jgi:hypothetical protein
MALACLPECTTVCVVTVDRCVAVEAVTRMLMLVVWCGEV